MKRGLIVCAAVMLVAGLSWSVEAKKTAPKETVMQGTLIDNQCVSAHQADLAEFVKTYTKECALLPECVKSGYSLIAADGTVRRFTKKSNAGIVEYLNEENSRLNVEVTVTKAGRWLKLVSIKSLD